MALISRVSRLFRADVHAVLDRIEEPEILLRQALREMEEELECGQRRVRAAAAELAQIETRQRELEARLAQTEDELALCFAADNEPLARGLVKRKLESQRQFEFLQHRLAERQAAADELAARVEEQRERLESVRQKAELLAVDEPSRDAGAGWAERDAAARFAVTDEEVEVAMLRERQKRRPE